VEARSPRSVRAWVFRLTQSPVANSDLGGMGLVLRGLKFRAAFIRRAAVEASRMAVYLRTGPFVSRALTMLSQAGLISYG